MNKKMKKTRNRIIVTLIIFFAIFVLDKTGGNNGEGYKDRRQRGQTLK